VKSSQMKASDKVMCTYQCYLRECCSELWNHDMHRPFIALTGIPCKNAVISYNATEKHLTEFSAVTSVTYENAVVSCGTVTCTSL
jgi:hypothetical protein